MQYGSSGVLSQTQVPPVAEMIDALTDIMYAIAAKVVRPARSSVVKTAPVLRPSERPSSNLNQTPTQESATARLRRIILRLNDFLKPMMGQRRVLNQRSKGILRHEGDKGGGKQAEVRANGREKALRITVNGPGTHINN